jgi:hypothetical protein
MSIRWKILDTGCQTAFTGAVLWHEPESTLTLSPGLYVPDWQSNVIRTQMAAKLTTILGEMDGEAYPKSGP